jgi:hypothetical protein
MKLFSLNAGTSRVFGLDLLRFFAIIFVVVGHSMILVPKEIKKHVVKEGENMTTISYQYYVDKNLISSSNEKLKFDTKADTVKVSKEKPARVSKILKAGQTIDIPVDGKFRKYVNNFTLRAFSNRLSSCGKYSRGDHKFSLRQKNRRKIFSAT